MGRAADPHSLFFRNTAWLGVADYLDLEQLVCIGCARQPGGPTDAADRSFRNSSRFCRCAGYGVPYGSRNPVPAIVLLNTGPDRPLLLGVRSAPPSGRRAS